MLKIYVTAGQDFQYASTILKNAGKVVRSPSESYLVHCPDALDLLKDPSLKVVAKARAIVTQILDEPGELFSDSLELFQMARNWHLLAGNSRIQESLRLFGFENVDVLPPLVATHNRWSHRTLKNDTLKIALILGDEATPRTRFILRSWMEEFRGWPTQKSVSWVVQEKTTPASEIDLAILLHSGSGVSRELFSLVSADIPVLLPFQSPWMSFFPTTAGFGTRAQVKEKLNMLLTKNGNSFGEEFLCKPDFKTWLKPETALQAYREYYLKIEKQISDQKFLTEGSFSGWHSRKIKGSIAPPSWQARLKNWLTSLSHGSTKGIVLWGARDGHMERLARELKNQKIKISYEKYDSRRRHLLVGDHKSSLQKLQEFVNASARSPQILQWNPGETLNAPPDWISGVVTSKPFQLAQLAKDPSLSPFVAWSPDLQHDWLALGPQDSLDEVQTHNRTGILFLHESRIEDMPIWWGPIQTWKTDQELVGYIAAFSKNSEKVFKSEYFLPPGEALVAYLDRQ